MPVRGIGETPTPTMARRAGSPDMQPLTADYDDATSDYSSETAESLRKPRTSFHSLDNFSEYNAEDGFVRTPARSRRKTWWDFWSFGKANRRARRRRVNANSQPLNRERGDAVLALYPARKSRRSRRIKYCISGGISALTILCVFLLITASAAEPS
jgi:hypothetical protein